MEFGVIHLIGLPFAMVLVGFLWKFGVDLYGAASRLVRRFRRQSQVVYVVGKFQGMNKGAMAWTLIAFFDSHDDALEACATEDFFVFPASRNLIYQVNHYWPLEYPKKKLEVAS